MYYHALIYQQVTKKSHDFLYKNQYHCIIQGLLLDVSDLLPTNLEIHWGLGETPQWIGRWTLQCPDGFRFHGRKSQRSPEKVNLKCQICGTKCQKDLQTLADMMWKDSLFAHFCSRAQGLHCVWLEVSLDCTRKTLLTFSTSTMAEVSARMQVPSGWWKLALVCNSLSSGAFPTVRL